MVTLKGATGLLSDQLKLKSLNLHSILTTVSAVPCPYCILSLGKNEYTSKAVANKTNPVWDQVFEFYVYSERKLEAMIMARHGTGDSLLGTLILVFINYCRNGKF